MTPLVIAVRQQSLQVARLLLDKGASATVCPNGIPVLLHFAEALAAAAPMAGTAPTHIHAYARTASSTGSSSGSGGSGGGGASTNSSAGSGAGQARDEAQSLLPAQVQPPRPNRRQPVASMNHSGSTASSRLPNGTSASAAQSLAGQPGSTQLAAAGSSRAALSLPPPPGPHVGPAIAHASTTEHRLQLLWLLLWRGADPLEQSLVPPARSFLTGGPGVVLG